jgi:hypothetical protein
MNASTITMPIINDKRTRVLPTTSRGRSLYIVDRFLHGKPLLRDHDNPQLTVRDIGRS